MKCQICGKRTDWDSSVGLEEFIVCNSCYEKIENRLCIDSGNTLDFIFACGGIRREEEDTKKKRRGKTNNGIQ